MHRVNFIFLPAASALELSKREMKPGEVTLGSPI